jgi:hypothetical protein
MPRVGFEPTIPAFDGAATVIGTSLEFSCIYLIYRDMKQDPPTKNRDHRFWFLMNEGFLTNIFGRIMQNSVEIQRNFRLESASTVIEARSGLVCFNVIQNEAIKRKKSLPLIISAIYFWSPILIFQCWWDCIILKWFKKTLPSYIDVYTKIKITSCYTGPV